MLHLQSWGFSVEVIAPSRCRAASDRDVLEKLWGNSSLILEKKNIYLRKDFPVHCGFTIVGG